MARHLLAVGRVVAFFAVVCLILVAATCKSLLIKPEAIRQINQDWETMSFVVLEDISASSGKDTSKEVIFKKGDRLKIYAESGPEWVRIKAYMASENREQARARTIIYIFRDELPEKTDILDYLPKKLNTKVAPEKSPEKKPTGRSN